MTKTLRFQSLALVASMGLCAALISGCNPEEPAKPITPAPAPSVTKPAPQRKTETKTPPAPVPRRRPKPKNLSDANLPRSSSARRGELNS